MLIYIAKVINFFTISIQYFLQLASCLGEIIVQMLITVLFAVLKIVQTTFTVFQIIYEDNISIFTDDLPGIAQKVFEIFTIQWENALYNLVTMSIHTRNKLYIYFDSVKCLLQSTYLIIMHVLILFKNTLVFVGDTTWLVLTFLPITLPQLLKEFLKNFGNMIFYLILKCYKSLLRLSNSLSQVPLESFFGILCAILVTRLCIQFRLEIKFQVIKMYWFLIRQVNLIYHTVYNYVTDSEVRIIASMSGNVTASSRVADAVVDGTDDGSDTLCVICQERQKCVLTLPCRHICLCTSCCKRLYSYQRTCPICRTFIYHSVNVYL